MKNKKSICMWCHCHCPVEVHVEENRLVGFEVDGEHPHGNLYEEASKGCLRRANARKWFYHPSRLDYPLKRTGDRGEGKWEQISWNQALDEIAGKLDRIVDEYGPEAIATSRGTGRTEDEYRARFFNLLGSPNIIGATEVCFGPAVAVSSSLLGWMPWPFPRRGITESILVLGTNVHSYQNVFTLFFQAQEEGAKLIVVDPRETEAAEKADMWLQIRPGTDAALLLAFMNVIIEEGLYDEGFVEEWCHGFEELVKHVKGLTPAWASEITDLPEEDIVEAARVYGESEAACSFHGMGIEHQPNAMQTLQARFSLPALTGNLDISGGDIISGPFTDVTLEQDVDAWERISKKQKKKQIGSDRFRLQSWKGYDLVQEENVKETWGKKCGGSMDLSLAHAPSVYRAVLDEDPYPVKALLTVASNPLLTQPNVKLIYEALKKLNLHIVQDFFLTPTAMMADYVLPAASWLERPYLYNGYGFGSFLMGAERAVPPKIEEKYNRRTDFQLWKELGRRLGQGEHWPWNNLEEAYDDRLEPMGKTFKEFMDENRWSSSKKKLKKYKDIGFGTPTGKVELYSTIFEKLGYQPLPEFREPPESPRSKPSLADEYEYILITGGRFQPYYHSEWRQIEGFRRIRPDPLAQIHPETAERQNINDGDWVWIETLRGKIKQKCEYFKGISPNVIHVEHGWWFPEKKAERSNPRGFRNSNANILTDSDPENCDPIGGNWPLRAGVCKIYKAEK
ncbi:hypothetical protein AKJ39_03295 [candidate division MSBL1 archaeon SCGC-AAA259J03]|uniref:4Fe-4S Mo/W bis-MGD-type domain-containing protein n=1 Tax=candidate division MSBL1 archaeon SCGC-AAA259J03 TaxID=1698269 RepID=A0A656YXL2_9EURY|nr:hypothetical protein AKJ39_03295 [candidate division MSBL1 archaeon SCGC-AAA259J03]